MNITIVPVHQVDTVWPSISEGLDESCLACGGDITAGDLFQWCRNGSVFLIVVHENKAILGACVWRSETWATGTKLRCLALYGSGLNRWIGPLREEVLKLAKNCGARSLVTEGLDKWNALFRRSFPKARRLRVLYEEDLT